MRQNANSRGQRTKNIYITKHISVIYILEYIYKMHVRYIRYIQGVLVLKVYIYIFGFQKKNGVKNSNTKNL